MRVSRRTALILRLLPRPTIRPSMRPRLLSSGGLEHRPEKALKSGDDCGQVVKLGPARTAYECGPLDLLLSVVGELAGERERTLSGYFDTSARECRGDRQPH